MKKKRKKKKKVAATASEEIRTEDRMGTKFKEKHHHAHWTLMLDKLHTPESTELSTHKQGCG